MHTICVVGGGRNVLLSIVLIIMSYVSPIYATTTTNNTKISVSDLSNGMITPSVTTAKANSTVSFTVTPAEGYKLKPGSLRIVYDTYSNSENTVYLDDKATTFSVPNYSHSESYYIPPSGCECRPLICGGSFCGGFGEVIDDCYTEVCSNPGGEETTYYYTSNITIYAEFELDVATYTVNHYIEQLDGSYKLYSSETKQGTIGSEIYLSSILKDIKGFLFQFFTN